MKYIQQITVQLNKMSEEQKNQWILSQAKLCKESERQGFLQTLTGEKKVPYMPVQKEIEEFCRKVENKEIYVEYETHYYEFDDDGRYMDDWKRWHNDPFRAMPFLDCILMGCHDLLILGEYGTAADILDRVCRLEFEVVEAPDSDEYAEKEKGPFTLADAAKERMLSRQLAEIGLDWIRAAIGRASEMNDSLTAREVIDLLQNSVCKNVHPHMLLDDELLEGRVSNGLLVHMKNIQERLCVRKEEFLAFADMLNQSGAYEYEKKAALLFQQYGREDKYISYLKTHLGKEGKTYAALVDCYQRQGNIDGAREIARQGLQQCRDELTYLFIWLLADARRNGDADGYKKLYASAKRRNGADIKKIDIALAAGLDKG